MSKFKNENKGGIIELAIRDSNGVLVKHNDRVSFSFGIPAQRVTGIVKQHRGRLILSTPNHKPRHCYMKNLESYVGNFEKV